MRPSTLLQEMLTDYSGTLILVSHDRDFLDRVVGSVLVSEGEGAWIEYAGGYTDMIAQRAGGSGPHRRLDHSRRPGRAARAWQGRGRREGRRHARQGQAQLQGPARAEDAAERIKKLESDIGKLRTVLADPQLYARDPARFAKASGLLTDAETQLGSSEDRWLELEMLRDA